MKNQIKTVAIGVAVIVILNQLGVFNALLIFVLVGAIPGTDYSLPSSFMLLSMLTAMWFLLFRWATLKTIHRQTIRKINKYQKKRKKAVPQTKSA